ncbi:MAG: zinc ABC transporter substrate-binding protein, partial [Muribaculaceae bacterium]|nr:zinc ABC transporter substrate-binding protein [Muribaculaceae bacterium]
LGCLDSLDAAVDSILGPLRGAAIVLWHPSLSYFAHDYGLRQIALGAEGREPSVADVKRLTDDVKRSGARVFLIQRDFDRNQADAIIGGLGDDIAVEQFSPLNYDFDAELLRIAGSIAAH